MAEKRAAAPLQFKVPLEGAPPKDLKAVVYVFDRGGGLLASAPLEGGGARLSVDAEKSARARVLIGPELPPHRKKEEPTVEGLQKIGAYEPAWRFDVKKPIQELLEIPERIWKPWWWCNCLIRGQVVRRTSVAGITNDYPVCHARVHLCEVDPFPIVVFKLPDDIILRIRDELLTEFLRPIPIPDPPPFERDPGWIDPSPELRFGDRSNVRVGVLDTAMPQRFDAPDFRAEGTDVEMQSLELRSEAPLWLRTTNVGALRDSLVANVDLVRPYFCWPWLWPWYTCDEFAVVETNADGRWEATYGYPCFGDKPDIYVWVEFFINGVWTSVYQPWIACSTYWDYDCGDDITIRLTDSRVPVCGEPPESPGKSVTLMAIGENVSTHEIQMMTPATASQGLTTAGQPFGGTLELRVRWGRTALLAAGITHYRWSYRRLTLSDGATAPSVADTFHHMPRAVVRHYDSPPTILGQGSSYPIEVLGPEYGSEEVFQIQRAFPSKPDAAGGEGWAAIDSHEDNATAFFETGGLNADPELAAGRYELKLELFRIVGGSPQVVDLTAEGVGVFIPTIDAPFGVQVVTTVAPPNDEFYFRRTGDNHVVGFRLVVRVDNNICHGNIIDVNIGGVGAGSCGFLDYHAGDDVTVSFMAAHPHNFATFAFHTYRGPGCAVAPSEASGNVGDASANGFNRSGTVFSKDIPVSTLLTSTTDPTNCPPCTKRAAFAETLWVYAMAVDGWQDRIYAYDAPRGGPTERANKAFALDLHGGPPGP